MNEQIAAEVKESAVPTPLSEFLESIPPGSVTSVSMLTEPYHYNGGNIAGYRFFAPDIQLHCSHDSCNGMRFFRFSGRSRSEIPEEAWHFFYATYKCSNCQETEKTFALAARRDKDVESGQCYKFGELPGYGPPTPARLTKLIGPDRDLFLRGRRCENQGLGIGAFVYYRRVVEGQKDRILDEILKVSRKLGSPAASLAKLEAAKAEARFSQALAGVKDAVPQALLINGHNPLLLLHSALSDGLHDRTDEHCLEVASSVRVVLGELAERLSQALKDEAELTRALAKLMNPGND
ncbi:TPA: hypothetical protein ACXIMI_000928 [Stenotrophomonas maltophilia]